MQALRQVVDAQRLADFIDMPAEMRRGQVEVLVFPRRGARPSLQDVRELTGILKGCHLPDKKEMQRQLYEDSLT